MNSRFKLETANRYKHTHLNDLNQANRPKHSATRTQTYTHERESERANKHTHAAK